jgi:hypothetical protein
MVFFCLQPHQTLGNEVPHHSRRLHYVERHPYPRKLLVLSNQANELKGLREGEFFFVWGLADRSSRRCHPFQKARPAVDRERDSAEGAFPAMGNLADLELHVRFEDVRLGCCLSIVGRCRVFFQETFPPQPRLVDSQEMRIMNIGPRSTSPSLKYTYIGHMS